MMKKFVKFVGGQLNCTLLLTFVLLTVIGQVGVEYDNFLINFWKSLALTLFVAVAVFICLVAAFRLIVIIKKMVGKNLLK